MQHITKLQNTWYNTTQYNARRTTQARQGKARQGKARQGKGKTDTCAIYKRRTPNPGLVLPPLDAVVDEARHVRDLLDCVLQEGTVGVIRVRVLQHTLQEKLVPAPHITEIPPGRHETVVR